MNVCTLCLEFDGLTRNTPNRGFRPKLEIRGRESLKLERELRTGGAPVVVAIERFRIAGREI